MKIKVKKIIDKKPGYMYFIDGLGNVCEAEVVDKKKIKKKGRIKFWTKLKRQKCAEGEVRRMKIPKTIQIHNRILRVRRPHMLFRNRAGSFDILTGIIYVRRQLKDYPDLESISFFHELSHGILLNLCSNNPSASNLVNDELFVNELGLNIRKVFLDLKGGKQTMELKKLFRTGTID